MAGIRFTLSSAFIAAIYDTEYYKLQDRSGKDKIRNYRRYYKNGQITIDKMKEIV